MKEKIGIISRITYILTAIFLSTTIFAGLQNPLGDLGLLIALAINLSIAITFLKKNKVVGSWQRIVGWTIIWLIISVAIFLLIGLGAISYTIDQTF